MPLSTPPIHARLHHDMPATILIVGATGNTGRTAAEQLSSTLHGSGTRLLALTRSVESPAAQALAKLAGVEVEGKNWTEIDAAWLKERQVERVYIAPHNGPSQHTDETEFYLALRNAGVKHVVRVSTLVHYVHADSPVYYGRSHWAVEDFLSQPGMAALKWTSLQPNFFTSMYIDAGAQWIKTYRETGKKGRLQIISDEHVPAAILDPSDVGAVGAALLALDDDGLATHASQRYVVSGPANVDGRDILRAVEEIAGTNVEDVKFGDTSLLAHLGEIGVLEKRLVPSVQAGMDALFNGSSSREGAPNSPAVVRLAEPKTTIEQALRKMTAA